MKEIDLTVYRKHYTINSTIGELFIDGKFFCYTLEDVCRDLNRDGKLEGPGEQKVHGITCIPAGRYQVIIDMSERFKKPMPHLIGVVGFVGIRIHNGNTSKDTDGCLLLGSYPLVDFVGNSIETFARFMLKLKALLTKYKVYINIIDSPPNF